MTISDEDRDKLIKFRIERARDEVNEVEFLLKNDKLRLAVNRVYYGMFYVLNALALKYEFKTSRHQQLIGWFNKNFVKEEKIDQKYGKIIRKAFRSRADSDYVDFATFEREDVEKMLLEMKDFISTIADFIKKDDPI